MEIQYVTIAMITFLIDRTKMLTQKKAKQTFKNPPEQKRKMDVSASVSVPTSVPPSLHSGDVEMAHL